MKKTLIGASLVLCGAIGSAVISAAGALAPITAWASPPGRFICTLLYSGTAVPMLVFVLLLGLGLLIMGMEYFIRDR